MRVIAIFVRDRNCTRERSRSVLTTAPSIVDASQAMKKHMNRSALESLRPRLLAFTSLLALLFANAASALEHAVLSYGGREMLVSVPSQLPPGGSRALVVVLHGGLGNAQRIASRQAESGLNMDAAAEQNSFVVAYLNGTPVTRDLGGRFLGWNAGGGCCGLSAQNNIDDVAYISGAIDDLATRYGINRARVYGIGHSNGAMMTQRLLCETTLYAAGVSVSGPLNLETSRCPAARGRRVLSIHGADAQNVPVAGGLGTKGLSHVMFRSEDDAQRIFVDSGATYTLEIVPGADHMLDHVGAVISKTEGVSIAEKAAKFFGILKR
jgi:poly(3-hydroxybutyrate) depolymerase